MLPFYRLSNYVSLGKRAQMCNEILTCNQSNLSDIFVAAKCIKEAETPLFNLAVFVHLGFKSFVELDPLAPPKL